MKIINKDQVSYIQIFNETKGVWSSWGYWTDLYYVPYRKPNYWKFDEGIKEGYYEDHNSSFGHFLSKEEVENSNKFFVRDGEVWTYPFILIFCGKDLIHKEYFTKFATLEQHVNYSYPNCKIKYE